MKLLYLVVHRLWCRWNLHRLLSSLIILGHILCSIALIYFYGNFVSYVRDRHLQDIYFRQYEIWGAENTPVEIQEMSQVFLKRDNINDIAFGRYDSPRYLLGTTKHAELISLKGRVSFSQEEQNGAKVVIAPFNDNTPVGSVIDLYDQSFTVIGQSTASQYYIPLAAFLELELTSNYTLVTVSERPDFGNDLFGQELQKQFSNGYVKSAEIWEKAGKAQAPTELFLLSCAYITAILSFLFLTKYLQDISANETILYRVVGASLYQTRTILLLENILLALLTGGAAIVLHRLLYEPLFRTINFYDHIAYTWQDYGILLLLILLLTMLASLPFVCSVAQSSIIRLRNRYLS